MRQDERAPFARALEPARRAGYPPGEYVGQESFMTAEEILTLARRAGVAPGAWVLDLCCGVAGPGALVAQTFACNYVGVDSSSSAIELARRRTRDLPCWFEVRQVPPVPAGRYDVVMLLETLLAFEDKAPLLAQVAGVLAPGGRFACTLEEGAPLTPSEQQAMPDADTVHLVTIDELTGLLARAGLDVTWRQDVTPSHLGVASALLRGYAAVADAASREVGRPAVEELLAAHRLWVDWMTTGRVRKFALVATLRAGAAH